MENKVVIVDQQGKEIGQESLSKVHAAGTLHRSFGVFVMNSKNQMLLQKRNPCKQIAGGLWSNACTSHPRPSEKIIDAATRRLYEEMGLRCQLQEAFVFLYKSHHTECHLKENEFGHVFIGFTDDVPRPNYKEVVAYQWMSLERLSREISDHPKMYTEWLHSGFDSIVLYIKNHQRESSHFMPQKTIDSTRIQI